MPMVLRSACSGAMSSSNSLAALAAEAEFGAGQRRQDAVAGAVEEQRRPDVMPGLGGELPALDGDDAAAVHLGVQAGAVEQRVEVFLEADFLVEDAVPDRVVLIGIAVEVLEQDFLDDAGLAVVFAVGAADPHADLGGGVAAEHRPFLHDHDAGAMAGRRDCRAQAGQAAADDANVDLVLNGPQALAGSLLRDGV